ncbi:MAG: histidine kinase N-terminal domain-containing protein [Candidatus Melainabacteria bacterium]|nr:histidine kinase N-terminal domain-containing protein [Candidatus Melainabacteria bacterium]
MAKNKQITKIKEICLSASALGEEEISRLESILDNFQFICDLLATDLMVYVEAKKADHYVLVDIKRPHGHPTLFLESSVGSLVSIKSEPFIKKTFESGKKSVGVYGVMIAGRPTQQVVYPIYHYEKIIAIISFEKDLYLTESLLGKNWNKVADDLVGALNQKRHRLKHWPKLVGQEGFILTDNSDQLLYVSYMAQNLLVSVLGIREKTAGNKLSVLLKDFHPEVLDTEPVINLIKKRYSGIGGTLQITSFDLSENNKIHVLRDISELSLKEKEIKVKGALVKEIHHRVKNNLNAVAALLRMQLRRSNDQAVKEAFSQAILRLDSITLVHEFLAQADNVQIVAVGQLIKDIVKNLQRTLGYEDKKINVTINCPSDFFLDSEQAVSIALVVNELISNCYEHAFINISVGEIVIDITFDDKSDDSFILVVKDNGVGLPNDFNKDKPSSLGWHIVNILVTEDLDGKICINNLGSKNGEKGTEIKIEAKFHAKK